MSLAIGESICGYLVEEEIGHGSQGETYIVVKNSKKYCMKVFIFRGKEVGVFKKFDLFEREVEVLKGMDIIGVPKYIDHFSLEGEYYLIMEYVEGKDLRKIRLDGGSFGEGMCRKFIEDIGEIVLKLGEGRITHRDINPKNVIWDGGKFWLVDFGGVKVGRGEGSTVVGTFGYMAMEQFRGKVERSTDWYGMGMTLVWMLLGQEPEELGYKEDGELDIGVLELGEFGGRILGWVKSDWKKRVWDSGISSSKNIGLERVKKFHLGRLILWLALLCGICLLNIFVSISFAPGILLYGILGYLLCLPAIIRNVWDGGVQKKRLPQSSKSNDWSIVTSNIDSKGLFDTLRAARDAKIAKNKSEDFIREFKGSVNWDYISYSQKLSEDFIREFKGSVNWYYISIYQKLSEDFIREFKDSVHWGFISKYQKLSEDFIREFKDSVDWDNISQYQKLSEDFIREFKGSVNWYCISANQKLSEDFIREFKGSVDWFNISKYQKLSEDFILEFKLTTPRKPKTTKYL